MSPICILVDRQPFDDDDDDDDYDDDDDDNRLRTIDLFSCRLSRNNNSIVEPENYSRHEVFGSMSRRRNQGLGAVGE